VLKPCATMVTVPRWVWFGPGTQVQYVWGASTSNTNRMNVCSMCAGCEHLQQTIDVSLTWTHVEHSRPASMVKKICRSDPVEGHTDGCHNWHLICECQYNHMTHMRQSQGTHVASIWRTWEHDAWRLIPVYLALSSIHITSRILRTVSLIIPDKNPTDDPIDRHQSETHNDQSFD
jgi:hypothetical protein